MIYMGVSKKTGTCAICKVEFPPGTLVYHNMAKREGAHLAHKKCWEDLRSTRKMKWKQKVVILSHEELDPPF